jgi:phosphohistidine phosphatase SixA
MSAIGWIAGIINAFAALATMMLTNSAASVSQTPDGGLTGDALRRGGYVIFIRHAAADQGSDANGFNLEDCATQRNLGESGIQEAETIGHGVRQQQIPIGDILSSEYCRAIDTSRLAFGRAQPASGLNNCCQDGRDLTDVQRRDFIQQALATPPRPGTNTVLVGHGAFMMTDLGMGEAAVYAPDGNGGATRIARILPDEWQNNAYRSGTAPPDAPRLAPNP